MWREVIDCEGPRRVWNTEQENGSDPKLSSVVTSKGKEPVCKGNRPQGSLKKPPPLTQQVFAGSLPCIRLCFQTKGKYSLCFHKVCTPVGPGILSVLV